MSAEGTTVAGVGTAGGAVMPGVGGVTSADMLLGFFD